ncbi:MAG TPA: S-layer homology domain-containing protein [Chloroflexia bacterium]
MSQLHRSRSWPYIFPLLIAGLLVCVFALGSNASAGAPVTVSTADTTDGATPTSSATSTATSLPLPLCTSGFVQVVSANAPPHSGLMGIGFNGPLDGWAAGYTTTNASSIHTPDGARTLIQRWNGVNWSIVPSPNQGSTRNNLWSILPLSEDDAWVVGSGNSSGFDQSLILHWDGLTWSTSPHPFTSAHESYLRDLHAFGPDDVWSMGVYYENDTLARTLLLHWDGTEWTKEAVPSMSPKHNYSEGFTAISEDDMWLVGYSGYGYPNYQTTTMHWDGTEWTVVPSPNGGSPNNTLLGVSGVATDDVWAVGGYTAPNGENRNFAVHWDGTQWNVVPVPNPGTGHNSLQEVLAVGPDDVWAVGLFAPTPGAPYQNQVLHWDGVEWSLVQSARPGTENRLHDIAVEGDTLWASGFYIENGVRKTLIQRLDMDCPLPTSTPSTTATPTRTLTATRTSTPIPTSTSTPTKTSTLTRTATSTHTNPTTSTPTSTPLPLPLCTEGFEQVVSPNAPPHSGLMGIGFNGPLDGWAAGYTTTNASSINTPDGVRTLIQRWNGAGWTIVPSPNQGPSRNNLWSILPLSQNNAWVVGSGNSSGFDQALVLHWDGLAWSQSPLPPLSTYESYLRDIYAFAPNDIWAMGVYYEGSAARTLLYHWDGSVWSQAPVPRIPSMNHYSEGFTAISEDDMWLVGYHGYGYPNYSTTTMHWDGTSWTVIPSPNPGPPKNALLGVSGVASDDVWAVGHYSGSNGQEDRNLAMHWDGTQWNVVPVPNPGTGNTSLQEVLAVGPDDVWAVGMFAATPDAPYQNQVMHWDGVSWSRVSSEHPGIESRLHDITVEGNSLWASGFYIENGTRKTLIQRLNRDCPPPTSTPSSTATRTRTSTPTATPTNTPTATPTPCTLVFEDVTPDNSFYPFVRCLACKGILGGYPCGGDGEPCGPGSNPYFRPGKFVTRAQLAKILSQAVGFSESIPDGQQTFEDVPPGSSFYLFVERLANRDVMGGYQCGILFDEPCNSTQRPYFRSLNNATRGQVSKMIANVAGFNARIPAGEYTFADVTDEHQYHLYVERWLHNRPGAISGYPCGRPTEPCDDQDRPYFRPNELLTRGQLAKVAANTFFPNCKP